MPRSWLTSLLRGRGICSSWGSWSGDILFLLCCRRCFTILGHISYNRYWVRWLPCGQTLLQSSLHCRRQLILGAVSVLEMGHQREPFPRLTIAQVLAIRSPLTEDLRIKIQGVWTVCLTSVIKYFIGVLKLLPGTTTPVTHVRPVDVHSVVPNWSSHRGWSRRRGRCYGDRALTSGHS